MGTVPHVTPSSPHCSVVGRADDNRLLVCLRESGSVVAERRQTNSLGIRPHKQRLTPASHGDFSGKLIRYRPAFKSHDSQICSIAGVFSFYYVVLAWGFSYDQAKDTCATEIGSCATRIDSCATRIGSCATRIDSCATRIDSGAPPLNANVPFEVTLSFCNFKLTQKRLKKIVQRF